MKSRRAAAASGRPWEASLVAALIALHVALAAWIATRNSVTFDENFHLPAGVVALARADFSTSYAQPPLARELCGVAALLAGARLPDPKLELPGHEREMGESFMRRNADRFQRVFMAGRLVVIAMSAALAWLIWRTARRRFGIAAGLVALVAWAFSPDALAHGSLVGVDLPTALVFFGAVLAGAAWLKTNRWRDWAVCAAWVGAAFLVRFSAVQLLVILAALAVVPASRRELHRPSHVIVGLAALVGVAFVFVCAGYLFQGVGTPLGRIEFQSAGFQALARQVGSWPSPLPVPYLRGLDYIAYLAQPGTRFNYFLGEATTHHHWQYIPVAIAVKWPIAFLSLCLLRMLQAAAGRGTETFEEATLLVPALVVIGSAMVANLEVGVRYVLPALPFLCVWVSGLAMPEWARSRESPLRSRVALARRWTAAAVVLVLVIPAEVALALPYPLSFFNAVAKSTGKEDRIVNDSNVDWGQGLLALRDDMARLGIRRVNLACHGTTDPALYGIDYVPYLGGDPGAQADWLAMSSYFYVGLPARMMTPAGSTRDFIAFDTRPFSSLRPVAHPGGCIYLFRLR